VGEGENCDVLNRGEASKNIVDGVTHYLTKNYGSFCDYAYTKPVYSEGLLRLIGRTIEGRGIKVSLVSSGEERKLLDTLMPSRIKYDQSLGLLSGITDGLTINLETKSYGSIQGKNEIESIQFYPIPLSWLMKVTVEGVYQDIKPQRSTLQVVNVKHWGTGLYSASTTGFGLLMLDQGYDTGWVGFYPRYWQKLVHVKVNGWANGWVVPMGTGDSTFLLFFWPQIFEWLGLLILMFIFGWLGLRLLGKRKQ
jgi:hypothetical protein